LDVKLEEDHDDQLEEVWGGVRDVVDAIIIYAYHLQTDARTAACDI